MNLRPQKRPDSEDGEESANATFRKYLPMMIIRVLFTIFLGLGLLYALSDSSPSPESKDGDQDDSGQKEQVYYGVDHYAKSIVTPPNADGRWVNGVNVKVG